MKIELKQDCKYSMLVATSMGIRITPVNGQAVHCSDTFKMYVTSAESNVASVSSYLGLPVKVLTAFVKDSPIARMTYSLSGRTTCNDYVGLLNRIRGHLQHRHLQLYRGLWLQ